MIYFQILNFFEIFQQKNDTLAEITLKIFSVQKDNKKHLRNLKQALLIITFLTEIIKKKITAKYLEKEQFMAAKQHERLPPDMFDPFELLR